MSRAIITVKTSDSFWHPLWKAHYSPHFDHYEVIEAGLSVSWRGQRLTAKYNAAIKRLLPRYSTIVCVDIDEILVPDPDIYVDLGDYLDQCTEDLTECVGYGVIEMEGDKPIDLSQRVTDQRKYWLRDPKYDKPVITKKRIIYHPGQHACNTEGYKDVDLRMFHLRWADADSFFGRRPGKRDYLLDSQGKAVSIPEKWRVI